LFILTYLIDTEKFARKENRTMNHGRVRTRFAALAVMLFALAWMSGVQAGQGGKAAGYAAQNAR
jgi:hypothetical protein